MNSLTFIGLFVCATALTIIAAANPGIAPSASVGQAFSAPNPGTYQLPVIKLAADGKVLDHKGRPQNLDDLTQGRVTVLSFIYTSCASAKACPMATGVLNQLHRASESDPALAKNLRLVSMSFDPSSDTPERMAVYSNWAGNRKNAADWHFLTTRSQSDLQPILDAYGQAVDKRRNPNDPLGPLNHTLRVYLIDPAGQIRNIYSSGTLDLGLVHADIQTLLMEKSPTVARSN